MTDERRFNYDSIPVGHYDAVLRSGRPARRLWHLSKFERVLDCLESSGDSRTRSILDIGCFAGSFLSMVGEDRYGRQVGVDILPEQVAYANAHFGTPYRNFVHIETVQDIGALEGGEFDCITLIEVIEHLNKPEIADLFEQIAKKLRPGGTLVLTTPNYLSAWPAIELVLNRVSDVSYEEQHITKLTYFGIEKSLAEIYPAFSSQFAVEAKTTTHFVTPFLAEISFTGARRLSRMVPHRKWHLPFGSLVLLVLRRK
jgi:2-polyprenyl-3-methyl-5-hydroxy-6-metoxy-1,4-benzoquinol methylase